MNPDRSKAWITLLLDLAQDLGLARQIPTDAEVTAGADPLDNSRRLPSDPATLQRLLRAGNDGAADMDRAIKAAWQRPTIDITLSATAGPTNINDDTGRIRLDQRVCSMPLGGVSWSLPGQVGRKGIVIATHAGRVEQDLAASDEVGVPRFCAVRPVAGESTPLGTRPGYELIVFPRPDAAYVITSRFRMSAGPMSVMVEKPIWPAIHDRCWLACSIVAFKGAKATEEEKQAKKDALDESVRVEREMAPRTLGQLGGRGSPTLNRNVQINTVDGDVLVPAN